MKCYPDMNNCICILLKTCMPLLKSQHFRVFECKSGVFISRAGAIHPSGNTFLPTEYESVIIHSILFSF